MRRPTCWRALVKSKHYIDKSAERSVNKRMADFIKKYAADPESREKCMSVFCIETHNYAGMDEYERQGFMNDREVFHWKVAQSIFGDARMLNDGEPQIVPLTNRAEPLRMESLSGGIIDWESAWQFCATMKISREKLQDALQNKNGDLYGFHVKKVSAVEFPYDPEKHNLEDFRPALGVRQGGEKRPIRMKSPNGVIIDWESARQFCKMTKISWKTLNYALKNKNGDLYGFHVKKISAVEFPYDPEKHKPEDYRPAPGLRSSEAKIIRVTSTNGVIIDWESANQFCKMTHFNWKMLDNALGSKGGELFGFQVEQWTRRIPPA